MGAGTRGKSWRWRSRRVLLIGVLAVALAGGGGAYALTHRAAAAEQTQDRTVAVALGTMQQTVSATGTIEPATQSDLSFQTSGTVQTLSATVGAKVAKGARLATIDDTALQSAVTLAQAQLVQARAQATDTASSGTATQIASANAQLAAAQAKLGAAKAALGQATLTSPIDGTVAAVTIQVGSTVSGSSGSGSGTGSGSGSGGAPGSGGSGGTGSSSGTGSSGTGSSGPSSSAAITVISTDAWIVSTQVTNADLPILKPGLQVQMTPTGARNPIFGTVQSVGIVATSSSSGVAQFPVTVAVTGKPTGLYAGTSASVSIIVKQLADVLTVPTFSVRTEGGKTVVTVRANGTDTTTPVTVGQVFGAQTQITAGLAAGAEVS